MEMDDNGEAMPGSPGTPPRAQEVPCRKQAGDFRGMHLGFRTMNLSQALKSTPDQRGGRPIDGSGDTSEACLDVDSLIRKCIHKAAAMVKDYEPDTDRKTKRVQMLLKLLNTSAEVSGDGEFCRTVLDVVNQRICQLLKDKEDSVMRGADNWLCREAASLESVSRAGTFRQALKQYVESKVTPLLAGLIAYVDRNRNMDLISNSNLQDWVYQLWLFMLQDPNITPLKYSDLQTVTTIRDGEDLAEFRVETSGCNKTLFTGMLPFSWVIYHQVDMLVYQAKSQQVKQDPEIMVERLLRKTAIGPVLEIVSNMGHMDAFIEMYLQDYVHMVYKSQSANPEIENHLIINCIRAMYRERHGNNHSESPIEEEDHTTQLTLPGIHLVYSHIQRRLHLSAQALQVWPEAVDKLIDASSDKNPPQLFAVKDEMTLDIQIVYIFLNELNLDKKFDDDKDHKVWRTEWVKKVDRFRPTIERILNNVEESGESEQQHGPVCRQFYQTCMNLWTRVMAVYLFVQHVCPPKMPEKTGRLYKCMPLWNILKDQADMRKVKSFDFVEGFLVSCNKVAKGLFFKKEKCKQCKEYIDNPTQLPCKHSICASCLDELRDLDQLVCPECKKAIPEDFDPKPPKNKEKEVKDHNQYKQRCNTFFMELVSRLCFHGSIPPEDGVITKLMSFVICEHKLTTEHAERRPARVNTRRMTLFKDSIDPTPVVRSFLLQLLLRSNITAVSEHLGEFLDRYQGLFTDDSGLIMELCTLCVHCLEDHYFNQANKTHNAAERADYIRLLLKRSLRPLNSPGLDIDKLEAIAGTRFGLIEVSRLLYAKYIEGKDVEMTDRDMWALFESAREVCMLGPPELLSPTSLYLMKQLFRQYGRPALQQVGEQVVVQWVIPPPARTQQEAVTADRFVSLGDSYTAIREMITEVVLGRNIIELGELLQNQNEGAVIKERNLLLAIYREITTSLIKPAAQKPTDQVLTAFGNFFMNDNRMHQQDLFGRLLQNRLSGQCGQLTVAANQNPRHMELRELLLHYQIVIHSMEADKLPGPLRALVIEPQTMMQSYLPTMPVDHLEEVRTALGETWWQCPNGHPYVIGNCGRPVDAAICRVCGAAVGGIGYNRPAQGNVELVAQQNRTAPGHILGRAQQRPNAPVPERLNTVNTSILRMLVHMSMFLGANRDSQNVLALVRQPAQVDDISVFLWEHITLDLDVIAMALGKNTEDSAVFMHLLLDRIISVEAQGFGNLDRTLRTAAARQEWENRFTQHYTGPVITNFERSLQEANVRVANDNRLGNNPLLRALYEVDVEEAREISVENIQQEPSMWSFRARITMEHLNQEFQKYSDQDQPAGARNKNQDKRRLLQFFLQEEHHLRVLHCLPGIVRLQRMLSQKFHRNIDNTDATKITLAVFKQEHIEEHLRGEFEEMIRNFAEAWELLRGDIGTFAVGGSTVPAEYCEHLVDDGCSLAMLLPTLRGQGLCATALVHYMVNIHNNFVENYSRITKQSLSGSISCQDITQAHLISYHLDRDLMPIVLANCSYTMTAGQNTTVEYDFGGLEKQIEERFMRGRPRIEPNVSIIAFREDFTNAAVFTQLGNKIKQDSLASSLQQQICGVLRHLTELNDSVATLDITIGFLVSVGGDCDMPILDFIRGTLKMESGPLGRAAQKCCLRHTQALWLLLAHQRAKQLTDGEQDAFYQLTAGYHDELEQDMSDQLENYFQHMHINNLKLFSSHLYECITLHVARKPDNPDAEDFVDNKRQPLGYVLDTYIQDRGYPELPGLPDDFPDEVLIKHCVHTWRLALRVSHNRR